MNPTDLSIVVDLLAVTCLEQNFEVEGKVAGLVDFLADKVANMQSNTGQMTDVLVHLYDKHGLALPKALEDEIYIKEEK